MAKAKTDAPETVADKAAIPDPFDVSLEEFCKRVSSTDRRVEIIGAFYHSEKKTGRLKGSESDYRARFEAFVSKPA